MVKLQWNAKVKAPKAAISIIACVRVFKAPRPSFHFHRRLPYTALSVVLLPLIACRQDLSPTADGKVHFGVSAPLTGDNAQYARLWRQSFDLALEDINRQGGVRGRGVVLDWEDSESDPKRAVNHAQRFTARSIPSVIYGPFAFGPDRRMSHQTFKELIVHNGAYVPARTLSVTN
jgi:ABC-type branched-subunit amino acid transport system substrate-binding protein